jgi:hypothetical protein
MLASSFPLKEREVKAVILISFSATCVREPGHLLEQ